MRGKRHAKSGGIMEFEKRIKLLIKNTLEERRQSVVERNGKIGITDYTDIDYPVYYEIKLERVN